MDPRPTPQTIGLAYTSYFTHQPPSVSSHRVSTWLGRFKAALRNDYLQRRYGAVFAPRILLGRVAVYMAIARRLSIDRHFRHLPAPQGRLLDVGCGNGDFLVTARSLGWEPWGIDPDREAVAAARAAGLRVAQGGFPNTGMPEGYFDAVTMNHVIEHLHDPVGALREMRRVLKPGGTIWIATPNLNSLGTRHYGGNCLSLDPPRHLVLFTTGSLKVACAHAGFFITGVRRSLHAAWIFSASERLARGGLPLQSTSVAIPRRLRWIALAADLMSLLLPDYGEELIVVATK
ncbi:MAG: class I SAM-dependent methyltransferase [Candidatus Entotheonellia bacterium]